jgi:YhcG PDDEXK nuclease domain
MLIASARLPKKTRGLSRFAANNPVLVSAEPLPQNFSSRTIYETAPIFLLELGDDFAFLGRQRRLRIHNTWFRTDRVFFRRRLRGASDRRPQDWKNQLSRRWAHAPLSKQRPRALHECPQACRRAGHEGSKLQQN